MAIIASGYLHPTTSYSVLNATNENHLTTNWSNFTGVYSNYLGLSVCSSNRTALGLGCCHWTCAQGGFHLFLACQNHLDVELLMEKWQALKNETFEQNMNCPAWKAGWGRSFDGGLTFSCVMMHQSGRGHRFQDFPRSYSRWTTCTVPLGFWPRLWVCPRGLAGLACHVCHEFLAKS